MLFVSRTVPARPGISRDDSRCEDEQYERASELEESGVAIPSY